MIPYHHHPRLSGVIALVLASPFLLTGCGTGPGTAEVAKFGVATTSAISVIGEAGKLENDLTVAYTMQNNACRYLRLASYQIAPDTGDRKTGRLQVRDAFLNALSDYASALAEATDRDAISKLKAAANKLAASAGKLATIAAVAAPGAAVMAPLYKLTLNTAVSLSEQQKMAEIRKIAAAVQPYLVDATVLIVEEADADKDLIDQHLKAWEGAARCSLAQVRRGGSAYQQFGEIDREKRGYLERVAVTYKSAKAMNKVQEAHRKLVEGSTDLPAAIEEINLILDDVTDLKSVLEDK